MSLFSVTLLSLSVVTLWCHYLVPLYGVNTTETEKLQNLFLQQKLETAQVGRGVMEVIVGFMRQLQSGALTAECDICFGGTCIVGQSIVGHRIVGHSIVGTCIVGHCIVGLDIITAFCCTPYSLQCNTA